VSASLVGTYALPTELAEKRRTMGDIKEVLVVLTCNVNGIALFKV
jgi:hypothetical protein